MKAHFLTKSEAVDMFSSPDEYALNLPHSNLKLMVPRNPTLEGYQEMFLESFQDFGNQSKSELSLHLPVLARLDFTIKLIQTSGTHALDLPQTRKDAILIPRGRLSRSIFIHEVYHVLSRSFPHLTPKLAGVWGFEEVADQKICYPDHLLNPDAVRSNFVIRVRTERGENLLVTPFMAQGLSTVLKVYNEERYLRAFETNYSSLIDCTSYHAHPEEICAEYFALSALGDSVFGNFHQSSPQLKMFTKTLIQELSSLGLLKSARKAAA